MKRFGKLPPCYDFILNPYVDQRLSTCPRCEKPTHERKVPLLIHVDPLMLLSLRMTCRFCSPCELLICHQDQLETQLVFAMEQQGKTELIGNDYLVLGTMDLDTWRRNTENQTLLAANLTDFMHDFKNVLKLEVTGGWMPIEKARELERKRARRKRRQK